MTARPETLPAHTAPGGMPDLVKRALACTSIGILIADARQRGCPIILANPAFCRMTGYSEDEILGRNCRFLQNDDRDQPELARVRDALAAYQEVDAVVRNYRKDGSLFWNHLFISPVTDEDGNVTHFVGMQIDITLQKRDKEQLAYRITCDQLTGLPKRHLLIAHLEESIQRTEIEHEVTALLILNIDRFRLINEAVDYEIADCLLKSAAERIGKHARSGDLLSRHGVDEFALVLHGVSDAREVNAIAEKLSRAMSAPFVINGENIRVTASIGIALYPQDGADPARLIRYANLALRRAKELGRNNTQFFSKELGERALIRRRLEAALRAAIENGQLALHYQPLVDLQTGKVIALEALARWTHPELGEVPPTRFIAVAEECGMIEQLGEWALQQACLDMRGWRERGVADLRVAVNVSPRQFRDPQLADKVASALQAAGIEAQWLSLEITENVLMQDTPASEATLERLRTLGIDLVLDDFGTGFSSLGYLKRFSFNKVKIDRSFVDNLVTDADDAAISKAVISMAHSLGIRVVAEGVETEGQCDFLRRNMCDEIQGFLVSPAIPPEQVDAFIGGEPLLPGRLLRQHKPSRTLLIVDDEVNILSALKRLLRRDNYTILTANSGAEGLALLENSEVDVIVSDQRMPGMTGVEFLGKAKELYPETVRMVLSGYSELQSVTDAVNQGAIYKFLMKPWDDDKLRVHVEEAFRRKELADENRRLSLEVQTANFELAAANRRLGDVLRQLQQQISGDEISLDVVHEVLQYVPVPIVGLDEEDFVAFANDAAQQLFRDAGPILGCDARVSIPDLLDVLARTESNPAHPVVLRGETYQLTCRRMGIQSPSRGKLVILTRSQGMQ